ncbi:MAG: flagellar motor protein MotB [Deltaproteobacteria bacterium]|nr:flagellar motor protein MotB [Deltaproteobacteria bacterium]
MAGKSKKGRSEDGLSQDGIRVMIVSLFIILLAFFIVLNSMAVIDDRRTLAALGSLVGSFGILPGGLSPTEEGDMTVLSPGKVPMSTGGESLEISGSDKPGSKSIIMRSVPDGEIVSIQDAVLFEKDSYKIKPAGYDFLKRLCGVINKGEYPVEITGHTDSRPPEEKSVHSNQELSSLRALEVLKFFAVVGDINPSRLTAYGCRESRPIASNETRQTRAQNRRVDILLTQERAEDLKGIYKKDESGFVLFKRFVFRIFD